MISSRTKETKVNQNPENLQCDLVKMPKNGLATFMMGPIVVCIFFLFFIGATDLLRDSLYSNQNDFHSARLLIISVC